jgi:hypothetical protein
MELKPDDRMLLTGRFSAEQVRAFAAQLNTGSLSALVPAESVPDLRRALCDVQNVLVVPEDPDGYVPWADGYFTLILAPGLTKMTPELARVLAADGTWSPSPFVQS